MDVVGNVLFLPSIICLLLALQWGGTTYPWSNGRIIALFTLFGVLLVGFIVVQIKLGKSATGMKKSPNRICPERGGNALESRARSASAYNLLFQFLPRSLLREASHLARSSPSASARPSSSSSITSPTTSKRSRTSPPSNRASTSYLSSFRKLSAPSSQAR